MQGYRMKGKAYRANGNADRANGMGFRAKGRYMAFALSLLLVFGAASPAYGTQAAKEGTDKAGAVSADASENKAVSVEAADNSEAASGSEAASKEETVYVLAKDDGTAGRIIVSEWLKNTGKKKLLEDYTELDQIENVKGNEKFKQVNGEGAWQSGGSDIYYQGEIRKTLPVEMKISYYLDGKAVSAKELSGKSGKVKIRFDYTNTQKMDGVYVPFVLLTSLSLDNEICSNVEVTNGKLINDGQKSMVVGYALPGLSESLDLQGADVDIPDYVEVTCDADKFELGGTMTVATSNLLNDLDLGSIDSVDALKDALGQLQSAAVELQNGSVKLASGAEQLSAGTDAVYNGAKTLQEKITQLSSGLASAKAGTESLAAGASQLAAGANEAGAGLDKAINGLAQTSQGDRDVLNALDQLQKAVNLSPNLGESEKTALNGVINDMKTGLNQTIKGQEDVSQGLSDGKAGMTQLADGANALASGAHDLNSGITAACEGAGLLEKGAGDLAGGAKQVTEGTGALSSGSQDLAAGIAKFKSDGVDKLVEAFGGNLSSVTDRLHLLQQAAADYQSFAGKKADTKGSVKFIYKTDEI